MLTDAQNGPGFGSSFPDQPDQPDSPLALHHDGPRLPGRRTTTISMAGNYGSKMRLEIWVDYPHKLANMIQGGDEDAAAEALCQIIVSHNNWCYNDGTPMPTLRPAPAGAREGSPEYQDMKDAFLDWWDGLPQELALAISTAIGIEVSKLMTAVRAGRRH